MPTLFHLAFYKKTKKQQPYYSVHFNNYICATNTAYMLKGYTDGMSALGLFEQIEHSKVFTKRPQADILPVQS